MNTHAAIQELVDTNNYNLHAPVAGHRQPYPTNSTTQLYNIKHMSAQKKKMPLDYITSSVINLIG